MLLRRTSTLSFGLPRQPAWSNIRQVAGVACITEALTVLQQLSQPSPIGCDLPVGDHHARAGRQREKQLQRRDVKGQRRDRQKRVLCRQARAPAAWKSTS